MAEEFDPAAFGTPVGREEEEVVESLGRETDLSGLGTVATDPVGAAGEAVELVRSGELDAASLADIRQEPVDRFAQFREEHGLSRASRELPEMFGEFNIDPRWLEQQQQMRELYADPEAGIMSRMGAGMMMSGGPGGPAMPPMTHRSSGVGAGLSMKDSLAISAAALTMYDPGEIAQMLMSRDETGERRYPMFAINQAPDGAYVVTNTENNRQAVINRPGMSTLDTMQALGIGAAFYPAGRVTQMATATAPRIALGVGTAGATEALIQTGQEAAGGQFDTLDVGLAAGMGPLADLVRPVAGGIQRGGRFIGSYIPESWGQRLGGMRTGLTEALGQAGAAAKAQALNFAENMRGFLQSARPAIIMTQDAVPEAHTPFRQILLKMVERLPLTGTGAARKAQQQQRVEVMQHIADRYNLRPNTNYGATVIDDLNRNAGDAIASAQTAGRQAVDELVEQDVDIILRDFRLTIRDLIEDEARYGDLGNQGVIRLLNQARNTIWQGGPAQDFGRGFGVMSDWLQRLRANASAAPPAARPALNQAADALEADLRRHAADEGGEAGARWLASLNQQADLVASAETRTLQSLMQAGEVDEGVMRTILRRGDVDELTQMYGSLTPEGRQAAQQMVLADGLRSAGWRSQMPEEMIIDPDRLVKWMDSEAADAQLRALFPNEADQNMLEGAKEYIRMTQMAARTGEGVGMAAAGGLPQQAANAMNLVTLGLVGALGQTYQSAPVRNLLLRLYHVRSDQRMKDAVARELAPLLMAGGRQYVQEQTAGGESYDREYLSADAQDVMEERNALGMMMDQLREATGQDEQENEDAAAALEQQLRQLGQEQ